LRAVALHPDVLVVTSRVWQTTCTVVRGDGDGDKPSEAFVVDSPVYPDELEVLPGLLEQAGFPATGLLATHGDWDHLLGRLAFPQASLGCSERTAARLTGEPGAAQRMLREFDDRHYVGRPRPLGLGSVQGLPVPGHLQVGARELELHPATGHSPDGMAIRAAWAGVLIAGDYLSPVEIPTLGPGGSLAEYEATLLRLRPLAETADHVVPGHGPVLDAAGALAVLEQDLAYLRSLGDMGHAAGLPRGQGSVEQRRLHAENAARVAG
jgi:glyoxylase-like metal-dependent hydrolase (beta-lactamase superfamily II)